MTLINTDDKKIFVELLLIIGGFMLADTIIKKVMEISLINLNLNWLILPLIAIFFIISAIKINNNKFEGHYFAVVSLFIVFIILLLILNSLDYINSFCLNAIIVLILSCGLIIFFIKRCIK